MWTVTLKVPSEAALVFQMALDPLCSAVAAEESGGADWRVVGYCECVPDETALGTRLALAAAATGTPIPRAAIAALPATDWLAANRRDFPPMRVGRYAILRSGHPPPPSDGRIALRLDASLAFGSGTHASTQGCLLAMERLARRWRPRRVLDLGCGSGILAIAAARSWPARVRACDADPMAVQLARRNAEANGVAALIVTQVETAQRALARRPRPDLILANLLAPALTALAPPLACALPPGGLAVVSGLLDQDEAQIIAAYRAQGLSLRDRILLGSWLTLVLGRRQGAI